MSLNNSVLVGGVFDPLHAGHLAYLEAAKQHGPLVCALSDAPEKHPPVVPIAQRKALLEALGVSHVIVHDGDGIPALIESLQPRYYVKGPDWAGKIPPAERAACERVGTGIVFTVTKTESSSKMLADYEAARTTETLADFETFVHTQASPKSWAPVTPYDRESRRAIEAPQADILAQLFEGLTVLDYGCGFGYLVELLHERGIDAIGWDPQFHDQPDVLSELYDVVICREVLEHVPIREWPNVVWAIATTAKRFVYITTRFTNKPHPLDVDGSDDLDPTHISITNQALLRSMLVMHGLRRRADLEARLDWKRLGRVLVYEVVR